LKRSDSEVLYQNKLFRQYDKMIPKHPFIDPEIKQDIASPLKHQNYAKEMMKPNFRLKQFKKPEKVVMKKVQEQLTERRQQIFLTARKSEDSDIESLDKVEDEFLPTRSLSKFNLTVVRTQSQKVLAPMGLNKTLIPKMKIDSRNLKESRLSESSIFNQNSPSKKSSSK